MNFSDCYACFYVLLTETLTIFNENIESCSESNIEMSLNVSDGVRFSLSGVPDGWSLQRPTPPTESWTIVDVNNLRMFQSNWGRKLKNKTPNISIFFFFLSHNQISLHKNKRFFFFSYLGEKLQIIVTVTFVRVIQTLINRHEDVKSDDDGRKKDDDRNINMWKKKEKNFLKIRQQIKVDERDRERDDGGREVNSRVFCFFWKATFSIYYFFKPFCNILFVFNKYDYSDIIIISGSSRFFDFFCALFSCCRGRGADLTSGSRWTARGSLTPKPRDLWPRLSHCFVCVVTLIVSSLRWRFSLTSLPRCRGSCSSPLVKVKQEVAVGVVLGERLAVWSSGGADWLQRRAGGRAAFLSGQQDTAGIQTSSSSSTWCCCCPLLDGDGGGGNVFVVQAFDGVVEVVHLHLLHLALGRGLAA